MDQSKLKWLLFFVFLSILGYITISGYATGNSLFMLLPILILSFLAVFLIPLEYIVPLLFIVTVSIPPSVKGMRISFGSFSLYLPEIILYSTLAILSLRVLSGSDNKYLIRADFFSLLIIALLAIGIFNFFRGLSGNAVLARRHLRAFLYPLSFIVFNAFLRDREDIKSFIKIWSVSIFIYLFLYYFIRLIPSLSDQSTGSFRVRFIVQMVPMSIIVFYIYRIAIEKLSVKSFIFLSLPLLFGFPALILSQDRSVWVSFVISFIAMSIINIFVQKGGKRFRLILMGTLIVIAAIVLFFQILPAFSSEFKYINYVLAGRLDTFYRLSQDRALRERESMRNLTMVHYYANPLLGKGFGVYQSHDLYSSLLALTGLLGTIPFLTFLLAGGIIYIILLFRLERFKDPLLRAFIVSQAAVYPAWLAINWVEPILWGRPVSVFAFMFTVVVGIKLKQQTDGNHEQPYTQLLDNSTH